MFIDLHCHILPDVDDGADSINEAYELINQATNSGTTIMVATPHINNKTQTKGHYNKSALILKYKELKQNLKDNNINANIFLGSELLADNKISKLHDEDEIISINGSRYVLTEFSFDETPDNIIGYCKNLINLGYIPLIAHPERYTVFFESYEILYILLDIGCRFQINKGSPLGKFGDSAKKISINMLNDDIVHVIASDCHSPGTRNSDMREIYEWLLSRYSIDKITKWTHDNAKCILLDMYI